MRVLIVEDSERLRRSLRTGLSAVGHEVDVAENGRQGLERLAAQRPDAVVLDLMMPEMSGLEMLRTLRADCDDVPVLVLSARDTAQQRVEGLRTGADDYLVKPFDFDEICARLEALERRAHPASRSPSSRAPTSLRTADGVGLEGQILEGKYRLHEQIGRGGFAVVHRARHLELDRWVAVKILHRRILDHPRNRQDADWLRREGTSVCRVRHPGAVAVLDAGRHDGLPFLVMELLEGETLAAEIAREGRLTVERCAEVVQPVTDVLQAAHDAGVVHRDVKPENVFFSREEAANGGVKVLDFGIAKWLWADEEFDVTALQTGSLFLGTLAYMAPERLAGGEIDGRYDVYGLCAMLYEALTGRLPLPAEGNLVTLLAALATTRPAAVRSLAPGVPPAIADVVERGLAKNPAARPPLGEISDTFRSHTSGSHTSRSHTSRAATLETCRLLEARVA